MGSNTLKLSRIEADAIPATVPSFVASKKWEWRNASMYVQGYEDMNGSRTCASRVRSSSRQVHYWG